MGQPVEALAPPHVQRQSIGFFYRSIEQLY
jgi:hypothetical protein